MPSASVQKATNGIKGIFIERNTGGLELNINVFALIYYGLKSFYGHVRLSLQCVIKSLHLRLYFLCFNPSIIKFFLIIFGQRQCEKLNRVVDTGKEICRCKQYIFLFVSQIIS